MFLAGSTPIILRGHGEEVLSTTLYSLGGNPDYQESIMMVQGSLPVIGLGMGVKPRSGQ